jgi:glycerol-3-phosphate O-acyltransferase
VDDILNSHHFQAALRAVEIETGLPPEQVEREAAADLKEMAAKPGFKSVKFWDRFSRWLARAYKIDVDNRAVESLKNLNRESSLIFLPNHRSYLDPLVLRAALAPHGFPPNHVLGGSNLALWPLSDIGQRNGIVFIRREFRDDPVYRAVLRAYLSYLIEERANLEWYIEGGRTRTGKLRPSRYGILSYVIDAYSDHPDNDVHIIPTSVIYDQQHEVGAISAEDAGAEKTAESLKWVYQFAQSQSRRLGRAHIRFGEPLSLREAVSLTDDENGVPRPRLAVPKVAFEVANRINAVTPITPTALVTFALLDNEDRAITVGEGRNILEPLLDYIAIRQLPVTDDVALTRKGGMQQALSRLVREKVVTMYDGGDQPVFLTPRDQQHEAAFYRNTIIHFFVARSITEIALLEAAESGEEDVAAAMWRSSKRLKEILKFEFFFPNTKNFAEEIAREASIAYPGWEKADLGAGSILRTYNDAKLHLAHRVLAPFLEAYSVMFSQLAERNPAVEIREDQIVTDCMGIAQQMWLQHKLHSPESISRDLFRNALKLADNLGVLEPGGPELKARRVALAGEIADAVERVAQIRRLARGRSNEFMQTQSSTQEILDSAAAYEQDI